MSLKSKRSAVTESYNLNWKTLSMDASYLNVKFLKQSQLWQVILSLGLIIAIFSWKTVDLIYAVSTLLILISFKNPLKPFSKFSKMFKVFNFFILLWCASNLLGSVTANNMTANQWTNFLDLRWIWSFYVCVYIGSAISESKKPFVSFLKPFLYLFTISLIIISLYGHFTPAPDSRFRGFYEYPNAFAFTFILAWAFLFGWTVKSLQNKQQLQKINMLLILALSALLYVTYTRGAWLAAFVCLLLSAILFRSRMLIYGFLTVCFVSIIAYANNLLGFRDRVLYSLNLSSDNSQGQRLGAWKASWNIFLDHPFFGTGFTENRNFFPEYYKRLNLDLNNLLLHSHNQYLQILNDSGTVGFIGFYGAVFLGTIFFFKRSFNKNLESSSISFGAFCTIIAFLVVSLFDCPLLSPESRNYLFLILGFSYGYIASKEQTAMQTGLVTAKGNQ